MPPTAFQGQQQMQMQRPSGPPAGNRPFQDRPPPGRFYVNQVTDLRIPTAECDPLPVTADDEVAFIHIALTENCMHDCFFENAKKTKLTPIFVRSSGDRRLDMERSQVLSELIGLGMPAVAWDQMINKLQEVKSGFKVRTMESFSEDMPMILQAKTESRALSFDISDKKGISSTGDCSSSLGASASQSGPSEVAAMMAAMTKMMTTQNEQMLQMQKLQTARERVKTPDGRARPKVAEDPGSGNPAARKRRPGSVEGTTTATDEMENAEESQQNLFAGREDDA